MVTLCQWCSNGGWTMGFWVYMGLSRSSLILWYTWSSSLITTSFITQSETQSRFSYVWLYFIGSAPLSHLISSLVLLTAIPLFSLLLTNFLHYHIWALVCKWDHWSTCTSTQILPEPSVWFSSYWTFLLLKVTSGYRLRLSLTILHHPLQCKLLWVNCIVFRDAPIRCSDWKYGPIW